MNPPGSDGASPHERSDASGRRRLPAAQRRVVILDAAVGMFASRGFHAAAMEEIASAAGISKAVVYDHFASKQELYTELLDTIRADLDAVVEAALANVESEGEPRVRVAIGAFFRYVEDHPDACRLLFLELQGTPEAADIVRELESRVTDGLTETLRQNPLIFEGHPARERQLRILAELLKCAIHGLASWWYGHPEVPRDDLVERTVALVWPAIERAGGGAAARA